MAGSLVTMVLADNGAEVAKVEPPAGDPLRGLPCHYIWQRGKKSVVLDLHRPEDRARAAQLATGVDVLVHNFRPGALERFGLDYPTLAAANPGLVHCTLGGLGFKDKYANVPGYEGLLAAKAGMMRPQPEISGRDGPVYAAIPAGNYSAAQMALQGILAALYERSHSGRGQAVRTSLLHGITAYDTWDSMIVHLTSLYGGAYTQSPRFHDNGAPRNAYYFSLLIACTKDGYWFQFANARHHMWKAFLKATELEWVFEDPTFKKALSVMPPVGPDFADDPEGAMKFWELLLTRMREKTREEWMEIFLQDDDIGVEAFYTCQQAMEHPQYTLSKQIVEFDDPHVGHTVQLGPLAVMDATPAQITRAAPDLGEHTDEVLRAWGDLTPRPPSLGRKGVPWVSASDEHEARDAMSAPEGGTPFLPREGGRGVRSPGPLAGVTVLELATYFAAPYGLTLLADYGARVIKVEPLTGDPIRNAMPIPESGGAKVTQGKESVAVDLYTEEGREVVYALARKADLVMCNWRQGVAQKLKIDDLHLRAINPNLVYLYGTSYGTDGPYARRPVYAFTATAVAGVADFQGGEGVLPPPGTPLDLADLKRVASRLQVANGMNANGDSTASLGVGTGMLLGLLARERTGLAQRLLTTMIGSNAYIVSDDFLRYEGKPPRARPDSGLYGMSPTYRLYETKAGWVFLAAVLPKDWTALCAALVEPAGADLAADPRFASAEARATNAEALATTLAAIFRARTAAEWEAYLLPREVGCVEVSNETFPRFLNYDPLIQENDLVQEVEHPIFGPHPRTGLAVDFSRTPGVVRPAPTIGQHTEAVLAELGYTPVQIEDLAAREIIAR
jgi:crotonobetainyl-CoA:carnitine CoA-transferase CaiB-like acyl-CoA transferase